MGRLLVAVFLFSIAACATRGAPEPTGELAERAAADPTGERASSTGCDELELQAQWEHIAREYGMELVRDGNELVASRGAGREQVVLHRPDGECRFAIRSAPWHSTSNPFALVFRH